MLTQAAEFAGADLDEVKVLIISVMSRGILMQPSVKLYANVVWMEGCRIICKLVF